MPSPEDLAAINANHRATLWASIRRILWPAIPVIAISDASFYADWIHRGGHHYFARSGALLTLLGAYIAYVGGSVTFRMMDRETSLVDVHLSTRIALLGLAVLVWGTLLWAYGDLFV